MEHSEGKIKIISYNVAGLPIPRFFSNEKRIVHKDTAEIGKHLDDEDYDIIGVQEDFNLHFVLNSKMNSPYRTFTSGGVPAGSGLNIYSKKPIYNVEKNKWDKLYGVFDGAQDALTPKGYIYCQIEVEKDVYIDFYDLHMDAADDEGSIKARQDNFRQLLEDLNSRSSENRAVILVGDFNSRLSSKEDELYDRLIKPACLKDGWAEFCNECNYHPELKDIDWQDKDSLDRILYRSGKGMELEIESFFYKYYCDNNGRSLSDHSSAQALFKYTFTDEAKTTAPKTLEKEKHSPLKTVVSYIKGFIKDIKLMICDVMRIIKTKR